MILVDSSIWIDHIRRADAELRRLLAADEVLSHPFVIGELACGHLRGRAAFLSQMQALPLAVASTHDEARALIERHALAGRGIGWVDVHLLAATLLTQSCALWSRDKRLAATAAELGCLHKPRLQ
ncbi:MAG TPA: type II toxin-antitoxin system VapC family toxin [Rubrivivax sp.]|nr:type II toxin-antitoxin system VapC family toxin [Rubrivivax sp.]